VGKMGFGTAPRRCGIHSKPQLLLQKTCLFYVSKTQAVDARVCLRTHALAHVPSHFISKNKFFLN